MHNTGNPLGSTSLLDLYDNAENIDYFANSQQDEVSDRFGVKRLTLAGLIKRSMALRNEINDFSGALTFKPEWSDVPMNVSEGVGGEGGALNLQAEALGNRTEEIKNKLLGLTRVSPVEKRFAGGADPTGVLDSTDALQACIDYCAPFEWMGSVSETKRYLGRIRAIVSGIGKFRITRPLKLSPFLSIVIDKTGGFFDNESGFVIIADFDSPNGFVLDTAPYDKTGTRILGRTGSRGDWDDGNYTGCMGIFLYGLNVIVPDGRNIMGVLNRYNSQQSHIHHCSFKGANIGIRTSVSWGGSVMYNHITARAICLYNADDTTIDYQKHNYLSVLGTKPTAEEFDYPKFPTAELIGMTCNVYNHYGHPEHRDNIWEGAEIGCMTTNVGSMHLEDNYIEGGSYKYILAAHTVAIKLSLHWVLISGGNLFHLTACKLDLDLGHCNYFSVKKDTIGIIDQYSKVRVLSGLDRIASLPFNSRVDYTGFISNGKLDIYVSETGNDNNTGYHKDYPVLTLQEAIDRCNNSADNIFNFTGNVGTKYNYREGGNVTTKLVKINSLTLLGTGNEVLTVGQSYNELHSLPNGIGNLTIKNIKTINIQTVNSDYRPLIPCLGSIRVHIEGGAFIGGTLLGVKYKKVGTAILTVINSELRCELQHNGGTANSFSWMDTAVNTVIDGGSMGSSTSKKISSVLYP